jgi:hypothetical protein
MFALLKYGCHLIINFLYRHLFIDIPWIIGGLGHLNDMIWDHNLPSIIIVDLHCVGLDLLDQ